LGASVDLIFLNHSGVFRNPQSKRMSHFSKSISYSSAGFHYYHEHRRAYLHRRTLLQLRCLVSHASKPRYGRKPILPFPSSRLKLHNTNLHWQREEAVPETLNKSSTSPKRVGVSSREQDFHVEKNCTKKNNVEFSRQCESKL